MTISEQLHLSVLSAPLAACDRRSLSQAWYSALYRGAPQSPQSGPPAPEATPAAAREQHQKYAASPARREAQPQTAAPVPERAQTRGVPPERRGAASPLARKIVRTFCAARRRAGAATFSLDGRQGRVRVLLRADGSHVKLVALCAPANRARVAAALAQARFALAARGIRADLHIARGASC
jgi:hypothetical protein